MDDRYEIRKKIGQGGLGSVYLGYDVRMSREVAIKRISINTGNEGLHEEATKQLLKEAGALASLQHPHVVTIYDCDTDEDGPFVVMELISGKTLDELIEIAPLTWADFREIAMQTQEALIAAQELNLIHSDIKPANLMLTWLPSGRFQIKIVDFGLATLVASRSNEELENLESVFGSIFFMAPEQFERVQIDARVDIYSMACVYYQALTGIYPFQGETGQDVMDAHLHHRVTPIQDVRAGIPMWVCEWIMWQLNCRPQDRPETSRQALQTFIQNDKNPNPAMSQGPVVQAVKRAPRARMAGAVTSTSPPSQASQPASTLQMIAPQALQPPEGSKPSVHSSSHVIPASVPTEEIVPRAATAKLKTAVPTPTKSAAVQPAKKAKPVKVNRVRAISVAIIVVCLISGLLLFKRIQESNLNERHEDLLIEAATSNSEILISKVELERYLVDVTQADTAEKKSALYKLLAQSKPNDESDLDDRIVEFAAQTTELLPEDRQEFIKQVVATHVTPENADGLIDFARGSKDKLSARAAFEAVKNSAQDKHFANFLAVISFHPDSETRKIAESVATQILKSSKDQPTLRAQLAKALSETSDPKTLDVFRCLEQVLR
jgi:serine/threonine protein kinase